MTPRQIFLSHIAQTSPTPLGIEIEKAKGIWLYSQEGKKYMDIISGISVSNVGHCHPQVVQAVQEQAEKFMHLMVYGEYIYSPQVQLAEKLTALLPKELDNFYFVNSGTEAVEGAFKLAKRYTGRSELFSFYNAYHGSTAGALSAMGSEVYKTNFRPLVPEHHLLHYNQINELDKITTKTAAVIVEMVQAEAGVIVGNRAFIQALGQRCKEVGALLIIDEIQTGCGRTGRFCAFEHYGIIPDILLLGKGFGGGMPIAAFIANNVIMSALSHNPILGHITTFGGNPVCCAAALATMKVLQEENIIVEVEAKGDYLEDKLIQLGFDTIRRKGLMIAIDMKDEQSNFDTIARCVEKGIITDWFLFNTQSMRICPPLTISYEEIDEFINKISNVFMRL